ncbi:MAG: hypothetical protein U0457_04415 [Candidatus Sericytochromatia bacterium]
MIKKNILAHNENKLETKNNKKRDLIFSILIDLLGASSYFFPAMGEYSDIFIAPLTAIFIYLLYKTKTGAFFGLLEEALPFTDITPTATILWYKKYIKDKK